MTPEDLCYNRSMVKKMYQKTAAVFLTLFAGLTFTLPVLAEEPTFERFEIKEKEKSVATSSGSFEATISDPKPILSTAPPTIGIKSQTYPKKIIVKVDSQVYNGGSKRTVYLSWSSVDRAIVYKIYTRLSNVLNVWLGDPLEEATSTSTRIAIDAFQSYYVKVAACSDLDQQSCTYSPELFIPAMKDDKEAITTPKAGESGSTDYPGFKESVVSDSSNTGVDELNQKVQNLEKALAESKKSQSLLEQRLNDIVSWIKSLFPFFK